MMRDLEHSLHLVANQESDRFINLVEASKLDRSSDFRGADLTNMIFDGEVLSNFDFSGADFRGSSFKKTIFKESIIRNAIFDHNIKIYLDEDLSVDPNSKIHKYSWISYQISINLA